MVAVPISSNVSHHPCPLHRSLPVYFRSSLPNMPAGSRPKLPSHWFVDQSGSNQVTFTEHPPLSSSCIDVAATVARNKPTYIVHHGASRLSPKILIIADYTLLVPLARFQARTRQSLERFWSALQGPKPFRIFIPTSSITSDGSLSLSEVSSWDDIVDSLALMVPLRRQELAPLITDAKIPTDLALVLDHTENVLDGIPSYFLCPATDTTVRLPEMD